LWCNITGISYLLIVGYVLLILPRLIFMHLIMHVIDKECIKISMKSLWQLLSFRSLWTLKTSIIVKLNGMSMCNAVQTGIDWEYWKLYNITQRSCHHMFVIFNMKEFCMFVGMSIIHDHNKCQLPGIIQCLAYLQPLKKIIYRIHTHTVLYILYT